MLAKIVMQCEKSSDLTTLKIVQSERAISGLSLKMVLLIALTSVKMVRDLQAKSTLFI